MTELPMPELQLGFNGTFALKKEDVTRIVKAAAEEQGLKGNRQSLIDRTGLGNEKVLRIKGWAIRAGLVSGDRLSPEGEVVYKYDWDDNANKYFTSPITDWLMHFYLSLGTQGKSNNYTGVGKSLESATDNPADWGLWTYFIYSFLPQHPSFTQSELHTYCCSTFNLGSSENPEQELRGKLRILLRAYCDTEALAGAKFITQTDKEAYSIGEDGLSNTDLIGYFLAKLWQRDFGETTSVLTDDILHQKMGLTSILGISPQKLQAVLNQLETAALIEQRRTVSPAQIIRRWHDPLTLLEKAYATQ